MDSYLETEKDRSEAYTVNFYEKFLKIVYMDSY